MDTLLQKSTRLFRRPWPLLLVVAVVTGFLALGMSKLKVDNDVKSMLPKTERNRAITELYDKEINFGSSNAVLVGVQAPNIFSLDTLTYIKSTEDRLSALNKTLPERQMGTLLGLQADEAVKVMDDLRSVGINDLNYHDQMIPLITSSQALQKRFGWPAPLADRVASAASKVEPDRLFAAYDSPLGKIQSLVSADFITNEDDALVTKKLVPNGDLTPENLAGLKDRVLSWDTYEGTLVSKDLSLTAITVILRTEDKDMKALFNQELTRITADPPAGIQVFVAGEPILVDHLGTAMAQDMPLLIPLMGLVLLLILFLCFRTVQGVVYPLLSTVLAVVWTLGLMGYLGTPLTVIGSMIPVLLMAIVSAYAIHQLNHFYEDPHPNKFEVLHHNARSVGLAILLSGLTVMIGFGSMVTLDFVPIRNFGIFTAVGDLVGVLAALYVLPALLMVGRKERVVRPFIPEDQRKDIVALFLRRIKALGHDRPGTVLVVALVVSLAVVAGAFLVKSDLDTVKFFPTNDSIRVADKVVNEKMAGTKSLSVIIDSDLRDPLTRQGNPDQVIDLAKPEVLQKVDEFARDVKARFPNVTKVSSYADALKKMNQVMNSGAPGSYSIPSDPALVAQYMTIFSGDTKAILTENHDKMRVMVTMNRGGVEDIHKIALYAQEYFDPTFQKKNHVQVLVSGEQQISYMANKTLLEGTMESTFACTIIVFVLLVLVLRNLRMSLIAVIPIFLCLAVNFGFMGYVGMTLNTATALVSSIGIGIGVDFSIHFITWYRRELLVDLDIRAAVDRTILHKGRAIVYNWLVIVGGFLVLVGSKMGPMHDFGLLTAICLTVTALGALVVVPAVIRLLARKNYRFLYLGVIEASPRAAETY